MRVRKALERLYVGTCDVIEQQKVSNPITKKTEFSDVTVLLAQPCRLSYKSIQTTGDGNTASLSQEITLFLSPDVKIKSGSKIVVAQRGEIKAFTNSSEPRIYDSHQEITLKLFERWS